MFKYYFDGFWLQRVNSMKFILFYRSLRCQTPVSFFIFYFFISPLLFSSVTNLTKSVHYYIVKFPTPWQYYNKPSTWKYS
jgi:hypothetical protein